MEHKGLRFNQGKLRFDLVHPFAHEQMVKVLTKGAEKYAERNWEKGMTWSNVIASLKRHLQAIESGEDFDPEITKQWLDSNGFPIADLYCVGHNESKVDVALKSGIDIFVDDKFENFQELNNAGICTFLMDASHNQRYNVGYKRIKSLKELL